MTTKGPARGWATAEGTARYAARQGGMAAAGHFRAAQGLTLSSVGLGTYLGPESDAADADYEAAVARALARGANVLDSAINYRCQRSERAVGRALARLVETGALRRDEVVVATKGGYLPFDGARPQDVVDYVRREYVASGLLSPGEVVAGCHCLAPRYLADQLVRSRRNLGLEAVDVYYLHNPEQQLAEVDRIEFTRRVGAAFAWLEERVAAGEIRLYGVATWQGLRAEPGGRDYVCLEALAAIARETAGEEHHFRLIQLPYNLAMNEAYAYRNQPVRGETCSVLEAARRLGMTVMASASLYQGHLAARLPEMLREVFPGLKTDAQRAIQFVRSTPGLAVSLVGMRQVAHVEENLALAAVPPAPPEAVAGLFQPLPEAEPERGRAG